MTWSLIIPLIVFGLLFVFLEIFILPGFVAGIVGGLVVIYGVYQAWVTYGPLAGGLTLLATILIFVGALIIFFRTGTWKRLALNDVLDGKMNTFDILIQPGDEGISISRLVPTGKALIRDQYVEVRTNGDFVDENVQVIITKIEDNKIYVRKK